MSCLRASDAQQSCLGNIVADADDDLVEDSQGIVHECLMARKRDRTIPEKWRWCVTLGAKVMKK